ncbi:MAG: hypothetical protein IH945_14175, partial [Armatimonadetes bacterium]|nr:hypothetical protein [Armatimonadota bacterium]
MPEAARVAVFAYNFPHKKTQDFLLRLLLDGWNVVSVIGADPVKLKIPPASIRTKLKHIGLTHPKDVAEKLGMQYVVMPHRGEQIQQHLDEVRPDIGLVAGARILKAPVIDRFRSGIVNLHPGLVPESRGLDAMLWSVNRGIPLGVTAHMIDEHIDAGKILMRREIPIYEDDTAIDFQERLYETQIEMLTPSMRAALAGKGTVVDPETPY